MKLPPDELLKLIGYGNRPYGNSIQDIPVWAVIELPTYHRDKGFYDIAFHMIISVITTFFQRPDKWLDTGKIGSIVVEALDNAACHGNNGLPNQSVFMGIWLGLYGIIFSFNDGGDFYKQEQTKKLIESRALLPSTSPRPCGVGLSFIYDYSDRILVDTEKGTLYVVVMKDSVTIRRLI